MESSIQCHCQGLSSVVPVAGFVKYMPEQVLEELLPTRHLHPSPPFTLWKGSCRKASPIQHPIPAWACGQLLELRRGACFPKVSRNLICSTDALPIASRTERGNSMFTLARSTLPVCLGGGTWKASHWAHGDGAAELPTPPAGCESPVNTAARGTNRERTMQTALTSHAFSGKLFQERNNFHSMLHKVAQDAWMETADTHIYTIMCIQCVHIIQCLIMHTNTTFIHHPIPYLYIRQCRMYIICITLPLMHRSEPKALSPNPCPHLPSINCMHTNTNFISKKSYSW